MQLQGAADPDTCRLAAGTRPTCSGPLGSDLGTWPHLETEPPTAVGGARGAAKWLVRRAAPPPQTSGPRARRCPGGSGPARSGLSQPGPPAPHRVDLAAFLPAPARRPGAELIQPVAWMPLGPNHDLRRQFAGFIFISAAPPRAGEPALCLLPVQPPPRPPGCRVDSPFSSLFLPWAPPAPSKSAEV